MTGPVAVFALSLLWAVVAYRTWTLRRPGRRPESWAIWAAVAALAGAATLFQPTDYHVIDTALGVPNFAEIAGHALILVSAWQAVAILTFLIYPRPAARRRVLAWGLLVAVTVALMATFFALAPVDRDVPQEFTKVYADAAWIVPYWVVFLFSVDVMLIDMVRLVLRYAKRTSREHLRFGLQLVAIGGTLGVLYWCQWVTYLVLRHNGVQPPAALHSFGTVCEMGGLILVVIGSTYPAIGPRTRLRTPTGWWGDVRRYRRLYPLWHALTSATPEIVLARPPRWVVDARFWLNRRVIEIEDGLLQLDRQRRTGAASDEAAERNPVDEARAIREALRTRPRGAARVSSPPEPATVDGDYAARLAWQLDVARAFARLPNGSQPAEDRPVTQHRS